VRYISEWIRASSAQRKTGNNESTSGVVLPPPLRVDVTTTLGPLTIWVQSPEEAQYIYQEIWVDSVYSMSPLAYDPFEDTETFSTIVDVGAHVGLFALWVAQNLKRASTQRQRQEGKASHREADEESSREKDQGEEDGQDRHNAGSSTKTTSSSQAPMKTKDIQTRIICVEAVPRNFHLLERNLKQNGYEPRKLRLPLVPATCYAATNKSAARFNRSKNVDLTLVEALAWSKGGEKRHITVYPNMTGNSTTKPHQKEDMISSMSYAKRAVYTAGAHTQDATTVTLSQIFRALGVERVSLLKIDVEGAEEDVLEGIEAQDWKKIEAVVLETHDVGDRVKRLVRILMQEKGFEGISLHRDPHAKHNLYLKVTRSAKSEDTC